MKNKNDLNAFLREVLDASIKLPNFKFSLEILIRKLFYEPRVYFNPIPEDATLYRHFGPRVYPRGSLVNALVVILFRVGLAG